MYSTTCLVAVAVLVACVGTTAAIDQVSLDVGTPGMVLAVSHNAATYNRLMLTQQHNVLLLFVYMICYQTASATFASTNNAVSVSVNVGVSQRAVLTATFSSSLVGGTGLPCMQCVGWAVQQTTLHCKPHITISRLCQVQSTFGPVGHD